MNQGEIIILLSCLYLVIMCSALWGMYHISRIWRSLVCIVLSGIHVFAGFVFYELSFIDRNLTFGLQTETLFTSIAEQLGKGLLLEEYIQPPALVWHAILSVLGALSVAGGLVLVLMKMRWWSWLLLCLALVLSTEIFSYPKKKLDCAAIARQNALRQRAYSLVKQRRSDGIPDKLLAETITLQMEDFRYTYENRTEAIQSAEKIITALNEAAKAE
ncbi:MAG: hypothetical protein J5746_02425 [Victivallales bacterium]|nr:hypothetical protein [Victivallales bacterium]